MKSSITKPFLFTAPLLAIALLAGGVGMADAQTVSGDISTQSSISKSRTPLTDTQKQAMHRMRELYRQGHVPEAEALAKEVGLPIRPLTQIKGESTHRMHSFTHEKGNSPAHARAPLSAEKSNK
jgi:hypothetical protein